MSGDGQRLKPRHDPVACTHSVAARLSDYAERLRAYAEPQAMASNGRPRRKD